MELSFTTVDDRPSIERNAFSLNRYLTKEDGEWVCNQQFKDYSLINQLVKR